MSFYHSCGDVCYHGQKNPFSPTQGSCCHLMSAKSGSHYHNKNNDDDDDDDDSNPHNSIGDRLGKQTC